MRFGSVCSGIEAASAAWLPLGWTCAFMSEIDAFPRAVLRHHYPDTPLHGDFTTIQAADYGPIDVLVGGTPCQSFSVAGLRGGISDARGNLALEYLRLVDRLRPRWVVWENVPGVLSSSGGRDFGAFLGGLGECGYGWSYRVLDAQYFGLAQRRKRVFVVGCAGDWRGPAQVLAIPEGLRGHPAPRRTAGEGIAASLTRGADSSGKGGYAGRRREDDVNLVANPLGAKRDGGWRGDLDNDTYVATALRGNSWGDHAGDESKLIAHAFDARQNDVIQYGDLSGPLDTDGHSIAVARSLNAHQGRYDGESETFVTHALRADGFDAGEDGTGRGTPLVAVPIKKAHGNGSKDPKRNSISGEDGDPMFTLDSTSQHGVLMTSTVRRLTPVECARLQGFPDVKKCVTIFVCSSDRQKNAALAEIQSRRSRIGASTASCERCQPSAGFAASHSTANLLGQEWPVAVSALINYGRREVQLRNQGRLLWSASSAEQRNSSPLLMPLADFVHLSALTIGCLVPTTLTGREDATRPSTSPENGFECVALSGDEINELASDVTRLNKMAKEITTSITSPVPRSSPNFESTLATWSCCVAAAIASFTREQIPKGYSYALNIETTTEYLDVSFRGKPAADGNKYRALGNSMAVPVMAWIGARIEEVSELAPTIPRRRSRNGGAMPADVPCLKCECVHQTPRRRATSSPGAGVFS